MSVPETIHTHFMVFHYKFGSRENSCQSLVLHGSLSAVATLVLGRCD